MKHVYEFEVFLDEGRYTVWPFDFECGGTSGAKRARWRSIG